jgi:hypothetical protein
MLQDYTPTELAEFLGPWLTTGPNAFEAGDVPPGRGLMAQNVEYKPGQVRTRYGFSAVSSLTGLGDAFVGMDGWLTPTLGNGETEFLVYLANSASAHPGFVIADPSSVFSLNPLYVPAGSYVASMIAPAGSRVYLQSLDLNGNGTDAPRVYSQTTISSTGGLDPLFQPPITAATFSYADGGTVSPNLGVTVGPHNFGILLTTRNGYTGAPGPGTGGLNDSGFVPSQFTVTIAGDALDVTVLATWPADAVGISLIMTTTDNLAQYYLVPGGTAAVTGGTTSSVIINVSIDDGTLAATATDATPYFDLFNTSIGTIRPSYIGEYSSRMVYISPDPEGVNSIFVSDPNNYQAFALSRSVIYLPGTRQALSAFNLYGNLYIVGPHWTYQTIDNGGDPVTWPSPQLIDGQIGTLSPNGITVNASQGVAWVADVDGLYMFAGGAFAQRPISYYVKSDWVRINWLGAAATVRVVDSKDTQRIHVLVPLDGATTPNFVMTFDYSRGATPETINYSLDSYNGGAYNPGAICIFQSPADHHIEVWLGPSATSGHVLHQNDGTLANPYRDDGGVIVSTYQTGLLPRLTFNVLHHVGDHLRTTGNGNLNLTATSLDGTIAKSLATISLTASPTAPPLRFYHILSEAATLTLNVNTLDANFVLSALTHYSKELVIFR